MSDFAYPLHEECGVFGIYDRAGTEDELFLEFLNTVLCLDDILLCRLNALAPLLIKLVYGFVGCLLYTSRCV